MIIQFFLTSLLAAIVAIVVAQRTISRLFRGVMLAVLVAGLVFVWNPDLATALALTLGVGRGADLLLYLWVVITLALLLFLYLETVRMGRRITELTRALALSQTSIPGDATVGGDAPTSR